MRYARERKNWAGGALIWTTEKAYRDNDRRIRQEYLRFPFFCRRTHTDDLTIGQFHNLTISNERNMPPEIALIFFNNNHKRAFPREQKQAVLGQFWPSFGMHSCSFVVHSLFIACSKIPCKSIAIGYHNAFLSFLMRRFSQARHTGENSRIL